MNTSLSIFWFFAKAVWPVLLYTSEAIEQKTIGDLLRENGYREDFAGAAYMNKFAFAFRIVNNIFCGRCNVTAKEEVCLAELRPSGDTCDQESAYYSSKIERKLDHYLPCLLKSSDEITMMCLMETPMGAPKLREGIDPTTKQSPLSARDGNRSPNEGDVGRETRLAQKVEKGQGASQQADKQSHTLPEKRKEVVDIVSHAKITRVIIGDNSGDPKDSPFWRWALVTSQLSSHVQGPSESETGKFGALP